MNEPYLSIVIPAYNESKRIGSTLKSIQKYFQGKDISHEIIVVNDGSTDDTVASISKLNIPNLKIVDNIVNRGKGHAVKTGMLATTGVYRLFMDADNSVRIETIEQFFEYARQGYEVMIGSIATGAKKVQDHTGLHRRILRVVARKIVKLFFDLGVEDTQRGFKLFSKRAANLIFNKQTISRFGFDIELLVIAKGNNFKIAEIPVDWNNPSGSKVGFSSYLSVTGDLLKIFRSKVLGVYLSQDHYPVSHFDSETEKEKGKGFIYRNKEFVHHTNLHHSETALYNLADKQKMMLSVIFSILLVMFYVNWHSALIILISVITVVYFIDLVFNCFLIYRTFAKNPEVKVSKQEIGSLQENELPTYTIFCPLYREWQVVPQFISAMSNLDYPANKLQVMLLLEENDIETIQKIREADLPSNFEIVITPHSNPKTKPKAMNYGLSQATGEYLVIYDAEDVPEPDQLKKAVIAFKRLPVNTACVQAKLNFYNPKQNLLTRVFTAEYSLWFDLTLPGLQSLNGPIPLGGTSNHFKVDKLKKLSGWDAFNVTEDCDLGIRLAKRGYRTAIVESTTYEEANSSLLNWYNQRSRWIKGYIQTYFVHMRNPGEFIKKNGFRNFIIFQLVVGGKITSMFINPFMWLLTIVYIVFNASVAKLVQSFFPGVIFYFGISSLVLGNFLYLYYYMIGCAKRGYNNLIKYAFLVPFYWIGMSIAAWKALYEIIHKPHYWSKTIHGLHLKALELPFVKNKI